MERNICDNLAAASINFTGGTVFHEGYFWRRENICGTLGCGRYTAAVDATRPRWPLRESSSRRKHSRGIVFFHVEETSVTPFVAVTENPEIYIPNLYDCTK